MTRLVLALALLCACKEYPEAPSVGSHNATTVLIVAPCQPSTATPSRPTAPVTAEAAP